MPRTALNRPWLPELTIVFEEEKITVPFNVAIENVKLMYNSSLKHLQIETAGLKLYKSPDRITIAQAYHPGVTTPQSSG